MSVAISMIGVVGLRFVAGVGFHVAWRAVDENGGVIGVPTSFNFEIMSDGLED